MKRKFLLTVVTLITIMNVNGQRWYILPDDPFVLPQTYDWNWMKKSTEKALNNSEKYSYEFLYDFILRFFYDHRKHLITISKDEYKSKTAFNWAKPYIKSKLSELEHADKVKLYVSLKAAQEYLRKFDYARETKYLNTNESLFIHMGPDEYFDTKWKIPYPIEAGQHSRKFEAFLFRRIRGGVSKELLETFLAEIIAAINVRFSHRVTKKDEDDNLEFEFFWDQNQYKGMYREYETSEVGPSGLATKKTWLKVVGEYREGKKTGTWKYYNFYTSNKESPTLDYEIHYDAGKPVKAIYYYDELVNGKSRRMFSMQNDSKPSGEPEKEYNLEVTMDIKNKQLDVKVFTDNKFFKAYSSATDYLEYWDVYEARRLILRSLEEPNLDFPIDRPFTAKDKPVVPRNDETTNYKVYDELKRSGKDHALLIATDQYDHYNQGYKLRNPIRDAETIAQLLKVMYGFKCEIVRNPTKDQFLKAFEKYRNRIYENDEQLLIFMTGHGERDAGMREGFIIPKDGKQERTDPSHSSWISYSDISREIAAIKANHILVMVDACYSGAMQDAIVQMKGVDSLPRRMKETVVNWFNQRIEVPCKVLITSTSADRQASDGINHSPFAAMVIRSLRSIKERMDHIMVLNEFLSDMRRVNPEPEVIEFSGHQRRGNFFFVMQ